MVYFCAMNNSLNSNTHFSREVPDLSCPAATPNRYASKSIYLTLCAFMNGDTIPYVKTTVYIFKPLKIQEQAWNGESTTNSSAT